MPGDHIVITGFSRGAYTARALAGFVHKIGLISTGNEELLPFAYKLYARTDKEGEALAAGFKAAFGRDVAIDFVGVWDTVVSVGVIASQSLPFTATNEGIKTFRHALALDEVGIPYPVLRETTTNAAHSIAYDSCQTFTIALHPIPTEQRIV